MNYNEMKEFIEDCFDEGTFYSIPRMKIHRFGDYKCSVYYSHIVFWNSKNNMIYSIDDSERKKSSGDDEFVYFKQLFEKFKLNKELKELKINAETKQKVNKI